MLVAVLGDKETHGEGALLASNNPSVAFAEGLKIVMVNSLAEGDLAGHAPGATNSATGSAKVFIAGIAVHRHSDLRVCGAATIVTNQGKVYAE